MLKNSLNNFPSLEGMSHAYNGMAFKRKCKILRVPQDGGMGDLGYAPHHIVLNGWKIFHSLSEEGIKGWCSINFKTIEHPLGSVEPLPLANGEKIF